jgi:hypothetical protein
VGETDQHSRDGLREDVNRLVLGIAAHEGVHGGMIAFRTGVAGNVALCEHDDTRDAAVRREANGGQG